MGDSVACGCFPLLVVLHGLLVRINMYGNSWAFVAANLMKYRESPGNWEMSQGYSKTESWNWGIWSCGPLPFPPLHFKLAHAACFCCSQDVCWLHMLVSSALSRTFLCLADSDAKLVLTPLTTELLTFLILFRPQLISVGHSEGNSGECSVSTTGEESAQVAQAPLNKNSEQPKGRTSLEDLCHCPITMQLMVDPVIARVSQKSIIANTVPSIHHL